MSSRLIWLRPGKGSTNARQCKLVPRERTPAASPRYPSSNHCKNQNRMAVSQPFKPRRRPLEWTASSQVPIRGTTPGKRKKRSREIIQKQNADLSATKRSRTPRRTKLQTKYKDFANRKPPPKRRAVAERKSPQTQTQAKCSPPQKQAAPQSRALSRTTLKSPHPPPMILWITTKEAAPFGRAPKHSSVAQWQSIRLLTGGL